MPIRQTRRLFLLGAACAAGGCNTISSLERSATTLDTFDLAPLGGSGAARPGGATLLVLEPEAPAALSIDRILVRTSPQSVSYLPDGRWVDSLPLMLQSLLIRSISSGGRMGFVGTAEAGPVPDIVLLTRVDSFDVTVTPGPTGARQFAADVAMNLTVLRDRDQAILGNRAFAQQVALPDDSVATIVAGFQTLTDALMPAMVDWVNGFSGA